MGLQSAMTTALTGLQASETVIDVVGNNIANSNTVGFKSSEVLFATQFLRTQSIGSRPSETSGGTNPRQVGLGVKVAQISPTFSQGTIEISSNSLDLAIQGDGFLMVQGGQGERLFTRNGQLGLNSVNEVVTPTGKKLLGYGVNDRFQVQETGRPVPITIPLGAERVAQETNTAIFAGVLNPTIEIATLPGIVSSEVLGNAEVEFPQGANFDDNSAATVSAPNAVDSASLGGVAASGLNAGGDYKYRVTLLDANGQESSASAETSITVVAANGTVDLTLNNTGLAATWTDFAIYRTEAGENDYYRVGTTAVGTPTFNDSVTDAALINNQDIPDAIENGDYSYYVTYFNPTGNGGNGLETRPSAQIGNYSLNDDTSSIRIDLSNLDSPTDSDFTEVRIYRNKTGVSSKHFLAGSISMGTSSFIDTTLSTDLTTEINLDGPSAGSGTKLVDVQTRSTSTYKNIFEEGTLFFTGEQNGSDLETKEFAITATTTMQNLIDFMTDALGLQEVSNVIDDPLPGNDPTDPNDPADPGGKIEFNKGVLKIFSNFGEENAIDISLSAFKIQPTGSTGKQNVGVRFSETQKANGPGTSTDFLVYDSLGSPLSVRITTVLESSDSSRTTYRWYASSGDSEPTEPDQSTVAGNGILNFDSKGDLEESLSGSISILRERTASESPLEIDLDFSSVTSLAETNALGEPTSSFNMTSQDGFPPGVLTDFIITESGLIQGQFSNGTQRTLGQVVMARFANNQGLQQLGDSLFAESVNSGEAQIGNPGENGLGALTAGAVELSNTDIGKDLIEMILAQTQYQAGSRVISAAQELLDELLALQR